MMVPPKQALRNLNSCWTPFRALSFLPRTHFCEGAVHLLGHQAASVHNAPARRACIDSLHVHFLPKPPVAQLASGQQVLHKLLHLRTGRRDRVLVGADPTCHERTKVARHSDKLLRHATQADTGLALVVEHLIHCDFLAGYGALTWEVSASADNSSKNSSSLR